MDAIILAGGMGTRLKDVVSEVPKPMAPIGDTPFLEHLLTWLVQYPIDRIIMAVGYKADVIRKFFGSEFMGKQLIYAEETKPLGTGGGIVNALNFAVTNEVLIINGDTYFPIDVNVLNDFHCDNNAKFSIALKKMENFDRYGTVELREDLIVQFNEKQYCDDGLINGGIYLVDRLTIDRNNLPEVFSFEKEILEKKSQEGIIYGKVFPDTFIDIGIPEDYRKACDLL